MKDEKAQIIVFCDEIWNSGTDEIHLSAIFVEKKFLSQVENYILNARYYPLKHCAERNRKLEDSTAWKNARRNLGKEYFEKHNRELSFSRLSSSGDRFELAKRWIEVLTELSELSSEPALRVKNLIINRENLDLDAFGSRSKSRNQRIYRRFFRSNVIGGKNMFWGKDSEIIQIWHDRGPQQEHGLKEDKIISSLNRDSVKFINSNHKAVDSPSENFASNMTQIADLIAGCLRALRSKKELSREKKIIAQKSKAIVDKYEFHSRATFPDKTYKVDKSFFTGERSGLPADKFYKKEIRDFDIRPNDESLKKYM